MKFFTKVILVLMIGLSTSVYAKKAKGEIISVVKNAGELVITGAGFVHPKDPAAPHVTLSGQPLNVVSFDDNTVVVESPTLLPAGDYVLTVEQIRAGKSPTGKRFLSAFYTIQLSEIYVKTCNDVTSCSCDSSTDKVIGIGAQCQSSGHHLHTLKFADDVGTAACRFGTGTPSNRPVSVLNITCLTQ